MIAEFIKAFFVAGVPVGVVSFLLVWWALRAGYFERVTRIKEMEKHVKRLSKEYKGKNKPAEDTGVQAEKKKFNPVHNKWLTFGGGFYGVAALMTFAIIEIGEIGDFFAQFNDNVSKLAQLEISMLIGFIIDSFMNFIIAIAWPLYWVSEIGGGSIWIWVLAAYAGYWLGARLALRGPGAEDRAT